MTPNRVLESVTGERMVILEDRPEVLRFELRSPPKQPPPPVNAHPTRDERFGAPFAQILCIVGLFVRIDRQ